MQPSKLRKQQVIKQAGKVYDRVFIPDHITHKVIFMDRVIAIALIIMVTGCKPIPACKTQESAQQAADGYKACILLEQTNYEDEGADCGTRAFRTFCEK